MLKDETNVAQGRSRRNAHKNDHFNKTSNKLLIHLASLSPHDSFIVYDKNSYFILFNCILEILQSIPISTEDQRNSNHSMCFYLFFILTKSFYAFNK